MKTKFSKRILSLFLAVMMVVTTIPLFSMPVAAAEPSESGLVGSYLTKDVTTGINIKESKGTISWDSTVGAAKFDGSGYLVLDGKPMEAVNSSTGFTISLDVMRTSNSQPMQRLLDFNNGSNASSFALNGGSDNNNERYVTLAKPNGTEIRYWVGPDRDGNPHATKTDYCSKTAAYDFLAQEQPGTWHNITVTMETSGAFSYYVDGSLFVTYKPEYYSAKGTDVTPEKIMNSFSGYTNYMVGKSIYPSDPCFTGYIKNLKLYDRAVDITSAIAGGGATDVEVLGNAIKEFEARMDGGIYQNMGTAYDYYVAANKAYDAAYYGGDTTTDVTTPAYNLTQAMLGMHKTNLTVYTANNPRPAFQSGTVPDSAFSNLIYSNKSNSGGSAVEFNISKANMNIQIGYNDMVFLYDATNAVLKAPVMFRAQKTYTSSSRSRFVYSVYPTTGSGATENHPDWELENMWYTSGSDAWNFDTQYLSTSGRVGHNFGTRNAGKEIKSLFASDWYAYANVMDFKTTNTWASGEYYKPYQNLYWKAYAGGGNSGSTEHNNTGSVNTSIFVINYLPLKNAINNDSNANAGVRSKVSLYKEGGISSYLNGCVLAANLNPNNYNYSSNLAGQVIQCATDIGNAVSGMTSTPTADKTANYPELRKAFDHSGKITTMGDDVVYSVREAYNNGVRKGFDATTYNAFATAYVNAQNVMKTVDDSGYTNGSGAASAAKALKDAFNALKPVNVAAPTLTKSTVLGPSDTIAITNNESGATVKYTIAYDGGTASSEVTLDGTEVNVFKGNTTYTSATVTAYATLNGDDSRPVSVEYTFYKAPTIAAKDGNILTETQTVAITSNNATAGTIQYSYDGNTWKNYTGAIKPFSDNKTTTANIYAREVCGNATSATVQVINLVKKATFNILSSTDDNSFNKTSTFTISDISGYAENEIRYEINVDGTSFIGPNVYNADTGIVVSDYALLLSAKLITITAYAKSQEGTDQKVTAKFFNSDNYNPLAYQESFDGAKISGTTFTTGSENGINGTLLNPESAEYVSGAGYKDGAGNSPDWRENVLKINASSTKPGNKITLDTNPLADGGVNASAALSSGATITFWRHIEDASGNTVSETDNWIGGITFQKRGVNKWECPFYIITSTGYTSFHNSDDSTKGDVMPAEQGVTSHSAGNKSGHWVQVAVSIDPNNGVSIYTNGEEHEATVAMGGTVSANGPDYAKAILEYITSSNDNASISICNSLDGYNKYNYYFDDIRIYSTAMTQLEINQMYTDKYADVQKASSTGHDPTAVAVYTLTNGKQVGENYIQKNNCFDQIAGVDYYIFGTGMTVYHSTDNANWEVIGDSEGRCGYQNQDLFGGVYTTALAEPLAVAAQDSSRAGAGKLIWAPHVMYNLTLGKWCYYGSTSSWGSQISAIFLCTSDNITGPYTYECNIVTSSGHPNAIDPVVFYDKDFANLYMLYGSWGGDNAIYAVNLGADGRNLGAGSYVVCRGINKGLEPNSWDGGSGEGAYVIYENGYYYLYVSYGQNTGSYTTRVFRSTEPTSGYVDIDGTSALDNTTATMHGNQFMHSFDLPIYDYAYNSTGHNSVYNAVNASGEKVTINAVHARPWATSSHGMKALEDGALSTRQVDLNGNVTLINQIGYTASGWPVAMPYQYSTYDKVTNPYTAYEIEGTYTGNGFSTNVNADLLGSSTFVITATGEYTGVMHVGTTAYNFEIKTASDGTCLINFYDDRGILYEGVLGQHDDNRRRQVPQIGFVNVRTGENLWAYMSSTDTTISCSEKVNVTFENLFSFDKFVNSGSASTTTSKGTASYDAVNRTITVTGSGDNYTNHADLSTVYKIPVIPGKTYYLDFVADNVNADAMMFVPNSDESGFDGNYVGFRGGHVNGQNRMEIKVPEGKNYVYFRFGSTNADNVTVTFSNIAFYEADRAEFRGDIGGYEKTTLCSNPYGTLPTPTRDGYHFVGWFTDKEYTNQVTAGSLATHTATVNNLYAKWEAHTYETVLTNNNNQFTWTKICTSDACDYSTQLGSVDATAYYAAVAAAEADIKNTAKYTAGSINELRTVVNNNKLTFTADNVLTQSQVETATNNIVYADKLVGESDTAVLILRPYTIKLYYVVGESVTLKETKENQTYGTTFEFTAPDGYAVEKWTRKVNMDTENEVENKVGSTNEKISVFVTSDADFYVHLKKTSASTDENNANIYLKNSFGKTVGVAYVPISETPYTVTVADNTLTINGQTLTAPALTFYSFSNFAINGVAVTNGQAITVTEDIEITALYSAINTYSITCDSTCTSDKETAYWDEKVTVTAADGRDNTKWFIDGKLVGYGKTYTFRACKNVSISCETPADAVAVPTATVTNLTYGGYEAKTITAIGSFSLPEGYTLVNTGVLLKTTSVNNKEAVNNLDNYTGANANAKKFIAENYVKDTKQFIINVHSAKEYTSLYVGAVAYVTYKDASGNESTAYSSLVTFQHGA